MLKAIEPQSTATVAWHLDPAVESYKEDYVDQLKGNVDHWRDMLTIKDGATPTVFTIGVIQPSTLARIESDAAFPSPNWRMHQMFWACLVAGLRDVEEGPFGKVPKDNDGVVDPEWIEKKFIRGLRGCGLFLGRVIWHWNTAQDDDAKNS